MLRRTVHVHCAVFLRQGVRDHALQIELVLPADADLPGQTVRCRSDCRARITAHEAFGWQHERLVPERGFGGQIRLQVLVFDYCKSCRAPRLLHGARGNGEQRLTVILNERGGKDRVVGDHGAIVVLTRDVLRGDHGDDTRRRAYLGEIDRFQPGMCPLAHPDCGVERAACLGDIVDVDRLTADMQMSAVVGDRGADATFYAFIHHGRHLVNSNTLVLTGWPEVSRNSLYRRFFDTVRR